MAEPPGGFQQAVAATYLQGFHWRHPLTALRATDRPRARVLAEILWMMACPWILLSPGEYLLYRLHRRDRRPGGSLAFIGELAWAGRCARLNRESAGLLQNKLLLSYLLAGSRIAAPATRAYLGIAAPLLPVPGLVSPDELAAFLSTSEAFPLFIKPLQGSHGRGCVGVRRRLPSQGQDAEQRLELIDGSTLPLAGFATHQLRRSGDQAIVQDMIAPHPALRPVCGDACPTVRVVTSLVGGDVTVVFAVFKLPSARSLVDNLHSATAERPVHLVSLEASSGAFGSWRIYDGREARPCPSPLPALDALPFWTHCLEIVATLHRLDPRTVLFGWDIAVSDRGPVVIEANARPGIDLFQLAMNEGFQVAARRPLLRSLDERARWIRGRRWRRLWSWLKAVLR
jgi:hypothetical protein